MGRRLALIIGNSAYRDRTLARLLTPDIDVGALAEILLDPEVGVFDDAKVLVNMTSASVRRAISDLFSQKGREDLLLLYFSGHGVLDDRGRLHLAVKDTDHNLLRGTAIAASFIVDEMDYSRSQRQVLILDCCHSGAFARGTKGSPGLTVGTAAAFEGTGFGRVVLTATDATQYAWEGDRVVGEAESSLFTHFLVQGLQSGEADINGDGQITIDELYDYVYAQVIQKTPRQTPGKWSFKEQGEIVIARAGPQGEARPIMVAQPFIDSELQQKLERLYTKGLSAYWLEEWEQAAYNFQSILDIQPDYLDAEEKYAEARRQLNLQKLYNQALAAFEAQQFREAVTTLETLVAEAPDYKDAASKLKDAQKQAKISDLYTQAKQLHQAGQWQAVIQVIERIAELSPDFVDPEELLSTARQAFEDQKRLAEIRGRYQQALQAMNAGRWQEAQSSFSQIQEQEPGFEETERLLARVEAEIAKQEAQRRVQERVVILYEQAIILYSTRQWQQALDKLKEIEILDPEFADIDRIAASAAAEMAREEQETQRQDELAALYSEAVRLLKVGQYQEALEKWNEVQAIEPNYFDRHELQVTAKKKLIDLDREPTLQRTFPWATVIAVVAFTIGTIIAILNNGPRCEPGVWYCEDFENGRADGWEIEPGWEVKLEGDNYVLSGTGHRWATLVKTGQEWKDYRMRFRLKLQHGTIHLNYRLVLDPEWDRYYIGFSEEGLRLMREGRSPKEVPARHALNVWHDVEIRGQKGHIQVLVNNRKELDYTDFYPILQGTIAFETLDGSSALVDDIEVLPTEP